jgi:hypothetical protein
VFVLMIAIEMNTEEETMISSSNTVNYLIICLR